MLDNIFIVFAISMGAAGGGGPMEAPMPAPATDAVVVEQPSQNSGGGLLDGTDETETALSTPETGAYTAEPQVPTGKFTTAVEIKPIMSATKGNWVAIREYDGKDLVYFSHILAWRCGLAGVRYSINGAPMQEWPLAPCQLDTNAPNAIPSDAKIYEVHPFQSVNSLSVELIYDDLTREAAVFERKNVLMP